MIPKDCTNVDLCKRLHIIDGMDTIKKNFSDVIFNEQKYSKELTICEVGTEKCLPSKPLEFKPIDYWVIHYCVSGKGYFSVNNQEYIHVTKGDVFMIPAHCLNKYYPDKNNPWSYKWIGLKGNLAKDVLLTCGLNKNSFYFHGKPDRNIEFLLDEILNDMKNTNGLSAYANTFKLLNYLKEIKFSKYTVSTKELLFKKILSDLQDLYTDDVSVENLSERYNIDRSYLFKLFKKYKNISPSEYIQKLRIQKSCFLLRKTDMTVTEISYESGFSSPSYFSKNFKKIKNITPIKYRKMYIEDD